MRKERLRALCLVTLLSFVFTLHIHAQSSPKLTAAQWQADVRFLGDELPRRHKNAYHRMKREDFEAAVNQLYKAVPTMTDDEIAVALMKLVAMVHDGHTSLDPRQFVRGGIYPIRLYRFSDGMYVRAAAPAYADLVGAKVLRIGGIGIDQAMAAVAPVVAADNEMGVMEMAPMMFSLPEIVSGLKITSDKQKLDITVSKDGKERVVSVRPEGSIENIITHSTNWIDAAAKTDVPLYMTHPGDWFWFEYLKDKQIVYVNQDAVQNKPDMTLGDFYKRVFDFIEANPVDKLVIDLRNNGGGNNTLNAPIIINLIRSKIDKRGHLFVITGRQTFSAAQNFVNQIEKWTEPIFIGEPTSDHVNLYGDNRPFPLPNSGLVVRASTLWWQDLDPRDDRKWTAPEIAADLSFDDYRLGRDPMFQAVLDYKPGTTISELIQDAEARESLGDFPERYRKIKADPRSRYVGSEARMNQLGYNLLAKKRTAEAVEIFRLNTEFYPSSANVHDSLGDGLTAAGRPDEAIKSYEKALSIDPNYPSSIEALKRLRKN
ncbi:MAG: tetratricopeptide repeat protein [Acidobacteriota bacterium]